MGVENVGGIFVVLLGGLSLAVIVALLEFMWNARKNSAIDKVSRHVHGAVGRFSSRLSYYSHCSPSDIHGAC